MNKILSIADITDPGVTDPLLCFTDPGKRALLSSACPALRHCNGTDQKNIDILTTLIDNWTKAPTVDIANIIPLIVDYYPYAKNATPGQLQDKVNQFIERYTCFRLEHTQEVPLEQQQNIVKLYQLSTIHPHSTLKNRLKPLIDGMISDTDRRYLFGLLERYQIPESKITSAFAIIRNKPLLILATDNSNNTPLLRAARSSEFGRPLINHLITAGAVLNETNIVDECPYSILIYKAIREGHVELVKALLENLEPVDINIKNESNQTPLDLAVTMRLLGCLPQMTGQLSAIIQLLKQHGAQYHNPYPYRHDPDDDRLVLHGAQHHNRHRHELITSRITDYPALITTTKPYDYPPLHVVAKFGHQHIPKIRQPNGVLVPPCVIPRNAWWQQFLYTTSRLLLLLTGVDPTTKRITD